MQQRLGRQYPAIQAVATLKSLFVDERLLDRMRIFGRPETFERDDFFPGRTRNRQEARTHRTVIDQHGACAALPQAATEPRIIHGEIIAKDVEKRAVGFHIDNVRLAVHPE